MDRWTELVKLLQGSPITERSVAVHIMLMIEKGRWPKEDRSAVDHIHGELDALVQKWRQEDRGKE